MTSAAGLGFRSQLRQLRTQQLGPLPGRLGKGSTHCPQRPVRLGGTEDGSRACRVPTLGDLRGGLLTPGS